MDLITSLPETKANHEAVMVIVDKLTKLVMFIPTRTDMDTLVTAKMFFNHWYSWFGLPKKIISDTDGRFISKFWKELFRLTQARLAMSASATLRQMDKQRKKIELWRRLSDSTSTTNKIIGTTHCRDSSMHTIVVFMRLPD
jgi:hypothetical protein